MGESERHLSTICPLPQIIIFFTDNVLLLIIQDKGRPLPKFGEWDVNDPASAEGFTVIFNKARDEKKTGGNARPNNSPMKEDVIKQGTYTNKPNSVGLKWIFITCHNRLHEWEYSFSLTST